MPPVAFSFLICMCFMLLEIPPGMAQVNGNNKTANPSNTLLHVEGNILAEGPWANVKAFGAIGDGMNDDAPGIQAAINAMASQGGTIYFPPGIYKTTAPIRVAERDLTLYGDAATILADHDGIALDLNPTSNWLFDVSILGKLNIQKKNVDNSLGSIGIRMRNSYHGVFKGFTVQDFHYGVLMIGDGAGCVYNLLEPRQMRNNYVQMKLTTINGGWCNQNTCIGGRWWHVSNSIPGAMHIHLANEGYPNNGNMFLHISAEAITSDPKVVQCDGCFYNTFIDFRTEGSLKWEFDTSSSYNMVHGGTYVNVTNITDDGTGNNLFLPFGEAFSITSNLNVGPYVSGISDDLPDQYIQIASTELNASTGIFLPVKDGIQNTRAWLIVDAKDKKLDLSHTWSSGGDLDYHLNRDRMVIKSSGHVGVGTTDPEGALDVNSTSGGLIVPRMTTAQRNALTPVNGMIIYNTTDNAFNFYENGAWVLK